MLECRHFYLHNRHFHLYGNLFTFIYRVVRNPYCIRIRFRFIVQHAVYKGVARGDVIALMLADLFKQNVVKRIALKVCTKSSTVTRYTYRNECSDFALNRSYRYLNYRAFGLASEKCHHRKEYQYAQCRSHPLFF